MLLKLFCLFMLMHSYSPIALKRDEINRQYVGQAQSCGGLVIWPSSPLILTRDRKEGESFPRYQCVQDFVEDLEIAVNKTYEHFEMRRHKRASKGEDLVKEACDDKKSTGNPWEEDIPRTAFRMLRNFLGLCDRVQETKTINETITNKNLTDRGKRQDDTMDAKVTKQFLPEDVVVGVKNDPFNKPQAEVWDFVEPDVSEKASPDQSLHGVKMLGIIKDERFVEPFAPTTDDGFKIQFSRAGNKIFQSFNPQSLDDVLKVNTESACVGHVDQFWLRDVIEYMGGSCWILGRFARKYYQFVHCQPGVCLSQQNLLEKRPRCIPGGFSAHTSWFYCPHLDHGERFRKFSFNLAQSCHCRIC